ncbi:HMG-box [Phanerochaete sordida]|uniref:HMG-box n=1 Tax=Phanerochaete sordida TaxID=48140 RepID=A0A9P3FX99_9APHY|nr:HMG-box [Phanerochaete sordida]
MAHLPESQAQFEYTKMQLIGSLGAVAETMRNAATFAEQFAQMLGPLSYAGAPLMFPNGQMPQMPPPQAEPTGGKRKARGEDDGEGKRKRKTKPKDPLAPKRPASSYLLFQNEVRQELKAKHPNIPNNELLAKIAKAWAEMPKEQKDRYEERHTASKNLYLERKRLYERSLPGAPAPTTEGVNPAVIAPAAVATPAAASSDQEDDENEGAEDVVKDSSDAESSEEDEEDRPPPKKTKPDSKTDSKEKKRKSKA